MNKKFTKLMAALALLVFMTPSLTLRAADYEIVFKSAASDSSTDLGASPSVSDVVESGSDYVASFSDCSKMYVGVSGIKLGSSKANGTMNFTLATNYQANIKSIKVVSAAYGLDTGTLTLYSGSTSLHSGITPGTDYTYTFDNPTTVTSLKLTTSAKRAYITKIIITTETSGPSAAATTTTIDDSGITNTDVYTSTTAGSLSATVTETESGNAVSGATVTWTSSKENVATIDENGVVTLVGAGTTTITASYEGVSGEFGASSATYDLTVTSSAPYEQPTTIEITPNYEFWGQTAQFSGSTYSELSGEKDNVTLEWTRGSGSTYASSTAMRFYKDNTLTFTAPTGYEIKSIVITFTQTQNDLTFSPEGYDSSTSTWTGSSETVTMSRPSSGSSYYQITKYVITLGAPSTDPTIEADNVNIAYDAEEGEIAYIVNNPVEGGSLTASCEEDWIFVEDAAKTDAEGTISFICEANTATTARTANVTLTYTYNTSETVTKTVTVTQAAYVPPVVMDNYARFTGDLIEGDYLIVYDNGAMNTTVTSDRLQFNAVTVNDDVIATDDAAIIWHIAPSGDYWTIYNADANAYAASTGAKNKAQMLADGTDDKALWTVSGTEVFEFVNKANAAASVNANLRKNGDYGFACYATATGGALTLYKKVTSTVQYDKVINGYNDSEGGYYLIASPIYGLNPANVTDMTDNPFDLYKFDQAEDQEWRNYEASPFYLSPGKGYLYAKKTNVTLHFEGMPYEGNGVVALDYSDGKEFAGWNLIGNPFATTAYLADSRNFYRMNGTGSELIINTAEGGGGNAIAAMEGVFVCATAANETVTFTTTAPEPTDVINNTQNITAEVSQNNGKVIDRAMIRFGNGGTLPKFQLNPNNTKLYFTQGELEYAVINGNGQGEMPVNFKASQNGTYTITITADNVEFSYLHLIDNKTGANIDLLATPSYTFEAKTTDYASRFRLVFSANNGTIEATETFAYNNGSEWVIGNQGEATLQVIDMMGRVLSSQTINGNATINLDETCGVYVLRLVNGENVKVQKIVVR